MLRQRSSGTRAVAAGLVLLVLSVASARGADAPQVGQRSGWLGLTLTEALRELQSRGLRIVFTSVLVRPEMRVEAEPAAVEPRLVLDEILAPHGLAAEEGAGGTLVVVRAVSAASAASAERPAPATPPETALPVEPMPYVYDEIVVRPSQLSLLDEEPLAPLSLSRDDIAALPHLAGDLFRALSLLPGTAANDVTAQFHVHGGRRDEVQILLDGQELYEAYHLQEFDRALSVVEAWRARRREPVDRRLPGDRWRPHGCRARHDDRRPLRSAKDPPEPEPAERSGRERRHVPWRPGELAGLGAPRLDRSGEPLPGARGPGLLGPLRQGRAPARRARQPPRPSPRRR